MPAFGDAYSNAEIAAVANYVTGRFGSAPSHLTEKDVAGAAQRNVSLISWRSDDRLRSRKQNSRSVAEKLSDSTLEALNDPQGESGLARQRPRRQRRLSTDSGVLADTPYSFKTRFENEKGTNPEELIAAAHAGCFTMALAFGLQAAGFTATELTTEAAVTLEPEGQGFRISSSALTLRAQVPNLDQAAFARIAGDAEKNCPVSKCSTPRSLWTPNWSEVSILSRHSCVQNGDDPRQQQRQ